jgi:hypothetical protein
MHGSVSCRLGIEQTEVKSILAIIMNGVNGQVEARRWALRAQTQCVSLKGG